MDYDDQPPLWRATELASSAADVPRGEVLAIIRHRACASAYRDIAAQARELRFQLDAIMPPPGRGPLHEAIDAALRLATHTATGAAQALVAEPTHGDTDRKEAPHG